MGAIGSCPRCTLGWWIRAVDGIPGVCDNICVSLDGYLRTPYSLHGDVSERLNGEWGFGYWCNVEKLNQVKPMSVMPKLSKARSVVCTTVLSMGLLLVPTATARVVEDSSSETRATGLDQAGEVADVLFSASMSAESVGRWDDPVDRSQPTMMAGGNIQLNTPCAGITPAKEYFGVWKPLGRTKAKCKEGATGTPGRHITRLTCRIVTINDGNFDNAVVSGPDHCVK